MKPGLMVVINEPEIYNNSFAYTQLSRFTCYDYDQKALAIGERGFGCASHRVGDIRRWLSVARDIVSATRLVV